MCKDCFVPAENQCVSCKKKKAAALRKKIEAEEEARIQAEVNRKRAELKAKLPDNQGYYVDPRDGIAYKVVKIGNQVWFAENFRNENRDFVDPEGDQNSKEYGYLYSQDCAKQLAPIGWRLPSERDFEILLSYVKENGTQQQDPTEEGGALPLMACDKWECSTTDDFGFSALPAGYEQNGDINGEGEITYFLSSTRGKILQLYGFVATASIENIKDYGYSDLEGHYSVRYIKEDSSFSKTLEEAQEVAREQAAEIAKQTTEKSRREAEDAKRIAEEKAKLEAEKARREAEEAKLAAEKVKQEAEQAKLEAEKACREAEEAKRVAESQKQPSKNDSPLAFVLALIVGWIGAHNFYLGQSVRGVMKIVLFVVACILAGVLSNPNASVAAFILVAFVPTIIDVALMFKAAGKLVNKIIAIIHFVVYGLLAIMGIIGLFAE